MKNNSPLRFEIGYVIEVVDLTAIKIAWLCHGPSDSERLEREWGEGCGVPKEIEGVAITRRSEWLVARVTLRKMLDHFVLKARLDKNAEFGFPELRDPTSNVKLAWEVSWSHTDGFAVVVLGDRPLGVDAEPMTREVKQVLSRIASFEEVARVGNPETPEGVAIPGALALWCAKEAAAKATGLGMRWGLKNFELGAESGGVWSVAIHKPGPRMLLDPAVRFQVQDGFVVALCGERAQLLKPPVVVLVR